MDSQDLCKVILDSLTWVDVCVWPVHLTTLQVVKTKVDVNNPALNHNIICHILEPHFMVFHSQADQKVNS